jgi:voltage-gated potassium channel
MAMSRSRAATAEFRRKLVLVCAVVSAIYVVGILGYEFLEGWDFLDSSYMTVITLATIGYGETHPLSHEGRVFTIFLILGGMSAVSWGLVTLTTLIAEGDFARALRHKRMETTISKLEGHYIVCGAGNTGRHIIHELVHAGCLVVVVDRDPLSLAAFQGPPGLFRGGAMRLDHGKVFALEGDASTDEVLREAGIDQAAGIFCALTGDKENLFVVLTARGLNPKLRIVSKCEAEDSDDKFRRAGADTIVSSNRIGGLRMASEMIRPTIVGFLDAMLRDRQGYRFEEIVVAEGSPMLGRALAESPLARPGGARVIALAEGSGPYRYNPPMDLALAAGQRLVLLGKTEEVNALRLQVNGA